jgi:hypothetical protein
VDIASGPDTAQWVIDIAGTSLLLAPVVLLAGAVYCLLSPSAQLRRMDKALERY